MFNIKPNMSWGRTCMSEFFFNQIVGKNLLPILKSNRKLVLLYSTRSRTFFQRQREARIKEINKKRASKSSTPEMATVAETGAG